MFVAMGSKATHSHDDEAVAHVIDALPAAARAAAAPTDSAATL